MEYLNLPSGPKMERAWKGVHTCHIFSASGCTQLGQDMNTIMATQKSVEAKKH
jgi:hypothetical protein